jgi:hypothetical protein
MPVCDIVEIPNLADQLAVIRNRHKGPPGRLSRRCVDRMDVVDLVERKVGAQKLIDRALRLDGDDGPARAHDLRERERQRTDIGANVEDPRPRARELRKKLDLAARIFALTIE